MATKKPSKPIPPSPPRKKGGDPQPGKFREEPARRDPVPPKDPKHTKGDPPGPRGK